jgi:hypothetical protein
MPAYPLFRVFPLAPPSFSILQMHLLSSPHRSLWSNPPPPRSTSRRTHHRKRSISIPCHCLLCLSITDDQSSDTTVPDDSQFDEDIERASGSTAILPTDPFQLRDGLLTEDEIAVLRRRKKGKAIAKYQLRQNNLIAAMLKPMEEHTQDAAAEEEATRLPVKIAIYASLICNFALCVIQMYAAISSGSLSLLATGIDSVFDIGSNVLLFWLHRKAVSLDTSKWPVGGARLETIGNIVYGFLMGSVNLVVIVESARTLIAKEGDGLAPFHLPSIIAVAAALVVKFLLFLYSYSLRGNSSQVQVLWQDHRNDLWINGFGQRLS